MTETRSIDADADVLVVGAGPVGMCLAIDLAWRGVKVAVIERRVNSEPPSPKCNHVAARTMEAFRRLGFAQQVREAGLPADHPHDVAFRTTTTGTEFGRIPIPSRAERYTATEGPDTGWPTPEPPHRINQTYLEPLLDAHARSLPEIQILNRTRCLSIAEDGELAQAQVEDLDSGRRFQLRGRYLVGCDGGSSLVRRSIGASLHGDAVILRTQSTYVRAPGLMDRFQGRPAWGTFSFNPRRSGMVYAIDGRERFLVHNYLRDDEPDFDSVDREWALRAILGVEDDFPIEIISQEDWYGRRLVVDRLRSGCVFLAGDAAHLWVPYAGYGMNAGIADALDLSWMLAGVLQGWGGPALLDAYEAERLPITEQVSRYAMGHSRAVAAQRVGVPSEIEDASLAGEAARAKVAHDAYALNVAQYAAAGLNFGYFYDRSPVIIYDGGIAPAYSMGEYTPATVPGCRVPHLWLSDGRSMYDALGPGFTLICPVAAPGAADAGTRAALTRAAAARGLPLRILDIDGLEVAELYGRQLVLARPDQHIAWRGTGVPQDPDALLDRVAGWAPAPVGSRTAIRPTVSSSTGRPGR